MENSTKKRNGRRIRDHEYANGSPITVIWNPKTPTHFMKRAITDVIVTNDGHFKYGAVANRPGLVYFFREPEPYIRFVTRVKEIKVPGCRNAWIFKHVTPDVDYCDFMPEDIAMIETDINSLDFVIHWCKEITKLADIYI